MGTPTPHLFSWPALPAGAPTVGTRPLDAGPLTPAEEGMEKDVCRHTAFCDGLLPAQCQLAEYKVRLFLVQFYI